MATTLTTPTNLGFGSSLGSEGTPTDRVNVTVTTSESIAMVDDPTFEAITRLEDKTTSFHAQGTVVQPLQHLTVACTRMITLTLTMQAHPNHKNDWQMLNSKELFKLLKEVFPKRTEMAGQTIYEYLNEKAKSFDFNLFDTKTLLSQCCAVLTKLETMTIPPGDVKQAVKQLTRDIIHGVGGKEGAKKIPYE